MNVDELIAAARVDATPTPDVVERHRTQLVARMRADEPFIGRTVTGSDAVWLDIEPQPEWPHRGRLAVTASVAVVVVVGTLAAVATFSGRDDTTQPTDSVTVAPESSAGTTPVPTPASTTEPTPTAPGVVGPQRVSPSELPALVGPLNIQLHPVTVDVAEVGGETLRLRMTETELCIETHVGDVVYGTRCDAPPNTLTFEGEERVAQPDETGSSSFSVTIIGPADIDLALMRKDGSPACPLVRNAVPEVGPIIVWTCDQEGLVEPWDLRATGDGLEVVADVPIMPPFQDGPLPSIGDPIPDVEHADWIVGWASAGIPARQRQLVAVARDGVIIGYAKPFTDFAALIYDLEGHPIGQFIDGKPVLDTEVAWSTSAWAIDDTLGVSMRVPDSFQVDRDLGELSETDIANGLFLLQRWYPAGAPQLVALSVQRDPGDAAPVNVEPGYRTVETSAATWKLVDFGEGDHTFVVGFARIHGYLFEITGDEGRVEQMADAIEVFPLGPGSTTDPPP